MTDDPLYALLLSYDGRPFCGWQRQINGVSVQEVLEAAALAVFGQKTAVFCAGRTDVGVHALGQVAHVRLPYAFAPQKLPLALNFYLPDEVRVLEAQRLHAPFHARFDALERQYVYRLLNTPVAPPLERGLWAWERRPLDLEPMRRAARFFEGSHDFSTFRGAGCQAKSPVKSLRRFDVAARGRAIFFAVRARSFLYHQVRNMVGSLLWVGLGQWPPEEIKRLLARKDRTEAAPTAPAAGLFLTRVIYREPLFSPQAAFLQSFFGGPDISEEFFS